MDTHRISSDVAKFVLELAAGSRTIKGIYEVEVSSKSEFLEDLDLLQAIISKGGQYSIDVIERPNNKLLGPKTLVRFKIS